jgi:ankyrin repeat protein
MVGYRDDSDMTPLHLAAAEGHLDVVEFLVRRGAIIDARSKDQRYEPCCIDVNLSLSF